MVRENSSGVTKHSCLYFATGKTPHPSTASSLLRRAHRPSWLPVPDFAVTALLGEGATVVLQGQKVKPNAVLAAGYKFKYERIDDALQNILR